MIAAPAPCTDSPISRLPPELLMTVFSRSSPGLNIRSTEPTYSSALSLAQTCSRWREICMSIPALWSKITVELAYASPIDAHYVDLYIEYSRDMPLVITISDLELDEVHAGELDRPAWDILWSLAATSGRWSQVCIDLDWELLDDHGTFPFADLPFPARFPVLESAAISWYPVHDDTDCSKSNILFDNLVHSPSLRRLQLFTLTAAYPFPLHQLTRITLSSLTHDVFRQLLAEGANIEYVSIDNLVLANGRFTSSISTSLRTLRISFEEEDTSDLDISKLFDSLTLPSLTSIHIQTSCPDFPLDSVITMLRRSESSLLDFSLNASVRDTVLLKLFQTTSNLRQLLLHSFVPLTGRLVAGLTLPTDTNAAADSRPAILLPKLNDLRLVGPSYNDHIPEIVQLVESRCLSQPCNVLGIERALQSFTLDLSLRCTTLKLEHTLAARLQMLSAVGLRFRLL